MVLLPPSHNARGNWVLSSLSQSDYERLEPYLEPTRFRTRDCIEPANKKIEKIFFPYRGLLSVIAVSRNKRHEAEAGVIGWEGMTGLPLILGTETAATNIFVQIEGDGRSVPTGHLSQLMSESPTLRESFLKHVYAFLIQAANTALANARGRLDQRLARWLLMAHDRMPGDELRLTHEFLALMLGVRRAGVTIALHGLESQSLISNSRGQITIVNREGLEQCCDGLYGVAERELARLFPTSAEE
ncbi:MAG: Crp/Fnr family transcriptional regulator [Proteobacteria bacterium]|nr:Crp/Fnr family transcriptional regulator [Pseudomonadota bacterium]